jgi:aminoglycoside phosphotransferase (APT) family kinase protein
MEDAAALVARVCAVYPALPLDPAQAWLDDEGQNNRVLIVGERYVFRFPRDHETLDRLRAEVALLRALGPTLPLPVPNPRYSYEDAAPGAAFMGL